MLLEINGIKISNGKIYAPFTSTTDVKIEWVADVSKYHTFLIYNITKST